MNGLTDTSAANVLFFMAMEAEKYGMSVDSDRLLDRARQLQEKSGRSHGIQYATMLIQSGDSCADYGRLAKAEKLYREALSILIELKGPDHLSTGLTMRNLADLLIRQNKTSEAAELNLRVSSILSRHRNLPGSPAWIDPAKLKTRIGISDDSQF